MKKSICLFLLSYCIKIYAQDIDMRWGVKIPMRDGIQLNATVFAPHDQKQSLPVIFTLTPYISDNYYARASYFAKHGFVFALVDVRGRGSSEGSFDPFMQEAKDGHDIVEWLAKQSYCNGKVTMWGGSYAGYDQWATAKELPPHLSTIVPVATARPGTDFPAWNNIFTSYTIQWLTLTSGKTGNDKLFGDDNFWTSKFKERYKYDLPFSKFDSIVGNTSTVFQKWINQLPSPDYVKDFNPTSEQYSKINLPILTITGSYDDDQLGALTYYKEFMQYAPAKAKENHYLIIGPWDHPGTRTPKKEVSGLIFGDSSLLDMNDLHRQWYNYTMKDSAKPAFLKNKVAYYITNKDQWKYAASLEDIGKEKIIYYLNNVNGEANNVVQSGLLQSTPAANTMPSQYTYDPLNKKDTTSITVNTVNYTDQTKAYQLSKNGLIYHSEPFEKEKEVSGFFELDAYIEADVKDMDIWTEIFEIKADGSSILLTSDIIRARYRDGIEQEKLLEPGKAYLYKFRNFTFISRMIEKGSRLRLIISSPNSLLFQKNYCSGGKIINETAKDAHTAHIKIYHDVNHPTVLRMPIN